MLKQTLPLLKNFPLTRTVGPALNKVHLPHELSSSAKAEIIDSHIIDPFDFKRPPSTRQDNPTVVFGNRLRRKGFPKGTGKMAPVLCVDLFTMLDEKPLARAVKAEIGRISNDQARAFAKEWRREQLSYMFRLNAMDQYVPFSNIVDWSLRSTLASHNLTATVDAKSFSALEAAQLSLKSTPDTKSFLKTLTNAPAIAKETYVYANAPLSVMDALITANQGDLGAFFSPTAPIYEPDSRKTDGSGGKVRSVDVWDMRCYKPSFLAYKQFEESVSALEKDCVLVTSHPWDVVGAKNAGWRVIWVDREGGGWIDGLGRGMGVAPDFVVATLDEMGDLWEKL